MVRAAAFLAGRFGGEAGAVAPLGSGVWSQAAVGTCQPTDGTDGVIHPGARMAYDDQSVTRVYFGGEMNVVDLGTVRYGNTVECY
jgi:hypothetical protein